MILKRAVTAGVIFSAVDQKLDEELHLCESEFSGILLGVRCEYRKSLPVGL